MSAFSGMGEDEHLLSRRIQDLCRQAERRPRFTAFLREEQIAPAEGILNRCGWQSFLFYGGYADAQRRVLGIFPEQMEAGEAVFPITALAARHGKGEVLTHRAVLGSLIALGLERDSIGDILPEDGICRFLVLEPVARVVLDDLNRIGRTGVRCESANPDELVLHLSFETLRSTVPSLRLDCLVSALTGLSREKSADLIRSGAVRHGHREALQPDRKGKPGDTLTIRGYGKFIVDTVGEATRKGRFPVACRKYK